MAESVPEFLFGKFLDFIVSDNGQDYDRICDKVFPGLRLWRNLFK